MGASPALPLALPFDGSWRVRNSPARRVPSHGTDLYGTRYAIDFIAVDERGRTATVRDWRTWLASEPPERFHAYGREVLAPVAGEVVTAHDGEVDHVGRRSQPALVGYALGQAGRVRRGPAAIAGNHLVLATTDPRTGLEVFVALVHLRRGSLRCTVGDRVGVRDVVAACGSSGNSTQPHLHLQVTDRPEMARARGLPLTFCDYRERRRRGGEVAVEVGVPAEGSVVRPLRPGTD